MKAQIHNFSTYINETNPDILFDKFIILLNDSGFKVLDIIQHNFLPYGYTALFLLGESHFAIHTFPEHNQSYIELSSCAELPFVNFIKKINE